MIMIKTITTKLKRNLNLNPKLNKMGSQNKRKELIENKIISRMMIRLEYFKLKVHQKMSYWMMNISFKTLKINLKV